MNKEQRSYTLADIRRGFAVLFSHTAGFRGRLSIGFALVILTGSIQSFMPYIFGKMVDSLVTPASVPFTAVEIMVFLSALFIINRSITNLQGRITDYASERMRLTFLYKLQSHLLRLPISFHKTHRQGEITDKIGRATNVIPQFWSDYIFQIIPEFAYMAFAFAITFSFSPAIAYTLLVAGILYGTITLIGIRPFVPLQRKINDIASKSKGLAVDMIFNVRMIKDAAWEKEEEKRIHTAWFGTLFSSWFVLFTKRRNLALFQALLENGTRIAALYFAYRGFMSGSLTIGAFSALATYVAGFFSPLRMLFRMWQGIQTSLVSFEEAQKILEEKIETYEGDQLVDDYGIRFDAVTFGYSPEKTVLKNLSFTIPQGKTVALVGESGVGKSSIIDLVLAHEKPQSGDVFVGGVSTKHIDLVSLRSSTAVVSQEITLFNDTILNNIRYSRPDATDAEVEEAARLAKCDFIEHLPHKWHQQVGERGLKLSVGQKQRVAIARAFIRNPKILILDEPTSALDASSEKHIVSSFNEIMAGRTTLIIAHRLSTVRTADMILVFKQGVVVESGTHDELIARKGEYFNLYNIQHHLS